MFKRIVKEQPQPQEQAQRRLTPRMFWKAVMIVTNHAYFSCRADYEQDPWKFPGMPSFRDSVDLVSEFIEHAIDRGWAENDDELRQKNQARRK